MEGIKIGEKEEEEEGKDEGVHYTLFIMARQKKREEEGRGQASTSTLFRRAGLSLVLGQSRPR